MIFAPGVPYAEAEFKAEGGSLLTGDQAAVNAAIRRLATPPSLPDEVLNCPEVLALVGRIKWAIQRGPGVHECIHNALKPFEGIGD